MELVLIALGACTATDIVIILEKKRQKIESFEVICSGERATDPPTVWTKLELLYRLRGNLDEAAVSTPLNSAKTNIARSPPCSRRPPRSPGVSRFFHRSSSYLLVSV